MFCRAFGFIVFICLNIQITFCSFGHQTSGDTEVTVQVQTDTISDDGFYFTFRFSTVEDDNTMYYSLLESMRMNYKAIDVKNGVGAIAHGNAHYSDELPHSVRVDAELAFGETYLLYLAHSTIHGGHEDLRIMTANIIHVPQPCPAKVDVAHTNSHCPQGSDFCTATCMTGYIGGPAQFTCEIDGTWSGDLVCQPVLCPKDIILSSHASGQCSQHEFMNSCLVSCHAPLYTGRATFVCDYQGHWQGSLACVPHKPSSTEKPAPDPDVSKCPKVRCHPCKAGEQMGIQQDPETMCTTSCCFPMRQQPVYPPPQQQYPPQRPGGIFPVFVDGDNEDFWQSYMMAMTVNGMNQQNQIYGQSPQQYGSQPSQPYGGIRLSRYINKSPSQSLKFPPLSLPHRLQKMKKKYGIYYFPALYNEND